MSQQVLGMIRYGDGPALLKTFPTDNSAARIGSDGSIQHLAKPVSRAASPSRVNQIQNALI